MSRRYDPTEIHEIDKLCLDRIIQKYWNRPETMSFETFFFSEYLLDEFTKKELIYMDINGAIPFQMLYFTQDDKEFAAVRKTILPGFEPRSRVTDEDTNHCATES